MPLGVKGEALTGKCRWLVVSHTFLDLHILTLAHIAKKKAWQNKHQDPLVYLQNSKSKSKGKTCFGSPMEFPNVQVRTKENWFYSFH